MPQPIASSTPFDLLDPSARLARLYQIEPHIQEANEYLRSQLSTEAIALLNRSAAFFQFVPVNATGDRRAEFQIILSSDVEPSAAEWSALREISAVLNDQFCVGTIELFYLAQEVA